MLVTATAGQAPLGSVPPSVIDRLTGSLQASYRVSVSWPFGSMRLWTKLPKDHCAPNIGYVTRALTGIMHTSEAHQEQWQTALASVSVESRAVYIYFLAAGQGGGGVVLEGDSGGREQTIVERIGTILQGRSTHVEGSAAGYTYLIYVGAILGKALSKIAQTASK